MGAALLLHGVKELLQLVALRRGVLGMDELIPYHVTVGAYEAHLCPQLFLQQMLEEYGGAGLAAGAGKAYEFHGGGGVSEKVPAAYGKAVAAVWSLYPGYTLFRLILAQHCGGPLFQSRGDELVSVHRQSLHRHKQVPGLSLPGVVADAAYLRIHIGSAFDYVYILQYFSEFHVILRFPPGTFVSGPCHDILYQNSPPVNTCPAATRFRR